MSQSQQENTDGGRIGIVKGREHEVLEQRAGRWDYTGIVYPEAIFPDNPAAEPIALSGVLVSELMPGNLWLISKAIGKAGGTPYEYMVIAGYNPATTKYTMAEANSLMPAPLRVDEGTYDEESKTLRWMGTKVAQGSDLPIILKAEEVVENADTIVTTAQLKRPGSDKFIKWYDFTQKRCRQLS